MENYLDRLEVSSDLLTEQEKDFFDVNGFLNLGPLLTDRQLEEVRNSIDALLLQEGDMAGFELFDSPYIRHPKEKGATRLANLMNKGTVFDQFYLHPRLLAAIIHVLGKEIKVSSLNYRAAIPGDGHQKLHVDWHETVDPGDYKVCNSIWMLDDFTVANGATRIVPGTHLTGNLPEDVLDDPLAPHPDEQLIEGPAGTVVIFNSHTWHGGTRNQTNQPRRAIHSYFCRRDQPQQLDQSKYITAETLTRIGEVGRYLLGV